MYNLHILSWESWAWDFRLGNKTPEIPAWVKSQPSGTWALLHWGMPGKADSTQEGFAYGARWPSLPWYFEMCTESMKISDSPHQHTSFMLNSGVLCTAPPNLNSFLFSDTDFECIFIFQDLSVVLQMFLSDLICLWINETSSGLLWVSSGEKFLHLPLFFLSLACSTRWPHSVSWECIQVHSSALQWEKKWWERWHPASTVWSWWGWWKCEHGSNVQADTCGSQSEYHKWLFKALPWNARLEQSIWEYRMSKLLHTFWMMRVILGCYHHRT